MGVLLTVLCLLCIYNFLVCFCREDFKRFADKEFVDVWSRFRGINFVLSALVFNVVPTLFEVSLVSAILVSFFDTFCTILLFFVCVWIQNLSPFFYVLPDSLKYCEWCVCIISYLSTHTVYQYKIQFFHYFGGIWPYWKMNTGKHNFYEILLLF